jgi:ATP/maltotriose-dependent transcriptional regulator MalT
LDTQDAKLGLRLARTLQFVWKWRLPVGEGRLWVEEVLELPGAETSSPARAVSLLTAAQLAWGRGDYAAADHYYAEAVPLARQFGDPWILFVALVDQGLESQQRGDYDTARSFWQEALVTTRASGDQASETILLLNLGRLDIFEGNYATGRAQCEEGLVLAQQLGDGWTIWQALNAIALAALAQGDLTTARARSYEGLNLQDHPLMQTGPLHVLGQVAIADGDYTAARRHLSQALTFLANSADPVATAQVVETLGQLAACVGKVGVAFRVAAAAEAARETHDVVTSRSLARLAHYPISRDLRDRWLIPLRHTLSPEDAERWWAEGWALSLDEAVALARSSLPATPESITERRTGDHPGSPLTPQQKEAPAGVARLSSREVEVLCLVAQGQSNKEIAAELVLSVRTVERHITNLYGKIDARGKADATAYAIHHGLV